MEAMHSCGASHVFSFQLFSACSRTSQGGNFHLKVGGARSSGNAGDPMLGVAVAVSGGYNHPNHKVGGGQKLCFSKKTFFLGFLGKCTSFPHLRA